MSHPHPDLTPPGKLPRNGLRIVPLLMGSQERGEVDALAGLLARYRPALYAAAIRMLRDRDAAQDAVQDACVVALVRLPSLRDRAAIGGWETFQLIRNSDGTVSLRALANNNYVTAENAGAQPLIANRTAIGAWEKFDLITQ